MQGKAELKICHGIWQSGLFFGVDVGGKNGLGRNAVFPGFTKNKKMGKSFL